MSNVKINLSTPPDQMWETMDEERVRAVRWYNRKIGGEKGEKKAEDDAFRRILNDPNHESQLVACHEWCSSGNDDVLNRWLCFEIVHYMNNMAHANIQAKLCYYESSSSVGFFIACDTKTPITDAGGTTIVGKYILCFTSHFFLRYCDPDTRNLGTMHDDKRQVIIDFFLKNHYGVMTKCIHQYKDKNGQELVDICLSQCVGRGKVRRGGDVVVFEFDTCLSWKMLHRAQYRELKPVLDAYHQHILDVNGRAEDIAKESDPSESKEYLLDDLEIKWLKHQFFIYNPLPKVLDVIRHLRGYIGKLLATIPAEKRDNKDVYDYMHDVGFYVAEGKKLAEKAQRSNTTCEQFDEYILNAIIKCCWHYEIPIDTDAVKEQWHRIFSEEDNNNNNNITNRPVCDSSAVSLDTKTVQTMNSVQIQELKRVLKDNGVKNFNTLPQAFSLNSERYLELAEPIYVISRLLPYVNSDNDRQKLMKAQKAWMNIVIQKQWCSALDSYIQEHGETLVQMAVEYCIDNDLWDSPKGNTALRTHTPDHFKGLEAIDEAVEYLKGEGFVDDTNKDESPKQEVYNTEVLDSDKETEEFMSSAVRTYFVGKDLRDSLNLAQKNLDQVMAFLNKAKDVEASDLEKENARLSARVRSLEAQIDVKTDEAKAAKEEAQKAKDERNEVQQNYTKKSQEYDRIVKVKREQADIIKQQGEEIKRLKADIEQGAQTLKKLKEQQKSSLTLPKRRILKESEILNLPLVGAKMISVLEPYLAKHDIIIDHNK